MLLTSTERSSDVEGIRAGDVSQARRRWSGRVASFACGFATLALLPMLGLARDDIGVSLPALSGVIVASLMLGAGLTLHLRFLSERVGGADRLRGMMLVLLAWTTTAIGAASSPHEVLTIQFIVGVIAGAILAQGLPGLPALYGAAAAALLTPPMCRMLMASYLGVEGSWPLVTGAAGMVVLALAGVSHALVRTAYVSAEPVPAKGQAPAETFDEELTVPAAA